MGLLQNCVQPPPPAPQKTDEDPRVKPCIQVNRIYSEAYAKFDSKIFIRFREISKTNSEGWTQFCNSPKRGWIVGEFLF